MKQLRCRDWEERLFCSAVCGLVQGADGCAVVGLVVCLGGLLLLPLPWPPAGENSIIIVGGANQDLAAWQMTPDTEQVSERSKVPLLTGLMAHRACEAW